MDYLEKLYGVKGKTAVITGGGGTLCGGIAMALLRAGANVALWGHRLETLEAKREAILKETGVAGSRIMLLEVDLLDSVQIPAALDKTVETLGQVEILVNGVGGSSRRMPLPEMNEDDFDKVMQLNLYGGCVFPVKYFSGYWIENGIAGRVINIASMASYLPLSGAWAYSAAKAGVVNQTMAQARELAKHDIRVNAIAPGFFIGKQNRGLLLNEDGSLTERGQSVMDHTPMKRFGQPEDLAGAVLFLAGDGAEFISGVTLPVDGAYLCYNI